MNHDLNHKLNYAFPGKVVRKDLTQSIKEGANVPVYVLEYLLGMYCATNDDLAIQEGVGRVKKILSDNYVRPDEAEKVKSKIRELGRYTIIDRVTVKLNEKADIYQAELMSLGVSGIQVDPDYVLKYEKLLAGGIWCILRITYEAGSLPSPFVLEELKPIQMPAIDMQELFEGRRFFNREEWMDVLLRSVGLEPTAFEENAKWHLIARMIPLIENNYNSCELGPRSTGKSHLYKEVSPNAVLISGGQTTVANLFYNLSQRQVGLVGLWDVVAFDEVAGINFKDKDAIQIMKDYMNSGSFARGKVEITGSASMVFVGNIDQSVEVLQKTSHLLSPFPTSMIDAAFFDRFHAYIPGWEIPKFYPQSFTKQYGMIVDYLAEWFREMRKRTFADSIEKHFRLGNNLNQRDTTAVRKTVSGLLKLLFPDGSHTKEDVRDCLVYALKVRRRIKEQLKKIGGMEFYAVHFSYIDQETLEEHFVSVPEMGGTSLIPDGPSAPGHAFSVQLGDGGLQGVYRIELQAAQGNGKLVRTGLANHTSLSDAARVAFTYFKANSNRISGTIFPEGSDYLLHLSDLQGTGAARALALPLFISLCSAALGRSIQSQMVILGDMTVGGTITRVENFATTLQVAFDAGAKRILIPMSSAVDIASVPPELFAKFQVSFYSDPVDAVFKALGVQ
ncbi:protease Lon-related BREX system protein BrxL [Deinococcus cellulosilyticus]|uniref:ATP-dependent Lon protease n=1 Tax=Deinococcus cellulosilyticus (strain DSM 18568 / NBRC 106333 / KACC 11606 / 5516J-15) TaxID=1223518 RepID=A0A511N8L1_DEIC1|nr:protease Lon-related BREX system protein BrxL [Deinococcus cellulosilyticus]GEM49174.1 ATP-dependent Lon protease [Deinococcus cellulosilyticus NBRC 106333 = KACC 11606]